MIRAKQSFKELQEAFDKAATQMDAIAQTLSPDDIIVTAEQVTQAKSQYAALKARLKAAKPGIEDDDSKMKGWLKKLGTLNGFKMAYIIFVDEQLDPDFDLDEQ